MLILVPTLYELEALFGESVARRVMAGRYAQLEPLEDGEPLEITLCGFGMAAAGAGAGVALTRHRRIYAGALPARPRALLAGLAGSYDLDRLALGQVLLASEVIGWGIGAGQGSDFSPAAAMGWRQAHPFAGLGSAGDSIQLSTLSLDQPGLRAGSLLSVCAASDGPDQAQKLVRRFPQALAEEMEGFAVALAARLEGFDLSIFRAISNLAGDRDIANWQTREAFEALRLQIALAIGTLGKGPVAKVVTLDEGGVICD